MHRKRRGLRIGLQGVLRGFVLLMLVLVAAGLSAQEEQTGTVEALDQDNGSITISGSTLVFSDSLTEVYLAEQLVSSTLVDPGMVVRYTLDTSGVVTRMELIGPTSMLERLAQH